MVSVDVYKHHVYLLTRTAIRIKPANEIVALFLCFLIHLHLPSRSPFKTLILQHFEQSLLLYLCYVFRPLINSLVSLSSSMAQEYVLFEPHGIEPVQF